MATAIDPSGIKVALLAGGASGERDISLASGAGAREALIEAGFAVDTFDPAVKSDLKALIDGRYDVAFICLHGKYGEDGTIQGLLEVIGLPYIGSGVWSSSIAMDKARAKVFYRHFNINTPVGVTLHRGKPYNVDTIVSKAGVPCVAKPANEGSAIGVHIVNDAAELADAIEAVFKIDNEVIVETYIDGTEMTVAVLGNSDPQALPVIEIVPKNDFYDFESKYAPGGSEHICPARIDEPTTARVQEIAVAAHKALGCRGMSRTDIIMDKQGVCWVLETNTVPGMTSTSLLPDAARKAGYTFPQLCTKLIELALEDVAE